MASRQADPRRFSDDRRDRPSRGSHRDDRQRDRDREYVRYGRNSYRQRSRSPSPLRPARRRLQGDDYRRYDERDRVNDYRDRHYTRDDRYRDGPRDRERDRERDRDRDRDARRPSSPSATLGNGRDGDTGRPGSRGSLSGTSGIEARRGRDDDRFSRDDRSKRDDKPAVQDKEAEKKIKRERLELWKKMQAEKASAKGTPTHDTKEGQAGQATAAQEPSVPNGTDATQSPHADKVGASSTRQLQKDIVQAEAQVATQVSGGSVENVQLRLGNLKTLKVDKVANGKDISPSGNNKRLLLEDEDGEKKSKLVRLDDWEGKDDIKTNDVEDGEEQVVSDKMDTAEDEVDPLDAFMQELNSTAPPANDGPTRGEAMFGEDAEPDLDPVGDELFSLVVKKKKKEVPVVNHSKVAYEPFRKCFYTEPSEVSEMTHEEVADLRLELDGIRVKPDNVPRPVVKWAQMGLPQQTLDILQQMKYTKPTSIQSQAIPIILSGKDMIGVAKTGSGKTLAFGMPIIRHALDQPPLKNQDGPIALIMAPTRELSLQIVAELKPFLKAHGLKITCAYGGAPISEQIAAIKRGVHVLCATPGRLIDLLQINAGRVLRLNRITYVVIDEADRMFDMGLGPQVMKVLGNIRPDRQTLLFSATFPKNMADLARKSLTHPAEVIVGGTSVVAPEITQIITIVPNNSPEKKMAQVLFHVGQLQSTEPNASALIFVERQESAEELYMQIRAKGYASNTIHGGKDQQDRTDAINDFKKGNLPVLIATSVAARGLDVAHLKLVINYDCPTHLEDYVHRCGRTGRAGNKGTAVTLIESPGQERFAFHIVKALKQSGQQVPDNIQAMADEFWKKVKNGEEKWFDPGFGGKGLDKLDAARNLEKKREKRALKGEFDDGDSESETEPLLPPVAAKTGTPAVEGSGTAAPADDEPAYMKLLRTKVVVHKTERPEPNKNMSVMDRVKAASQNVGDRLSKKGTIHHGQPIDNKGPDAGAFHSTIEINDFPQKARWAVTNRTNVAKILESTGVSITTKGTYYPQNSGPKEEKDLPPLYILVEGDTENVVQAAMMEITRLLRENALAADEAPARAPGRYSVL